MSADLIHQLRIACPPEYPLGKLLNQAADEIERVERNRDMYKGQCERQALSLEEIRTSLASTEAGDINAVKQWYVNAITKRDEYANSWYDAIERAEAAEAERDAANSRWAEVCADFIALQKAIVGNSGLSAILRVDALKAAESRLSRAEELLKPFIKISADIPEENFWPTDVFLAIRAASRFLESDNAE